MSGIRDLDCGITYEASRKRWRTSLYFEGKHLRFSMRSEIGARYLRALLLAVKEEGRSEEGIRKLAEAARYKPELYTEASILAESEKFLVARKRNEAERLRRYRKIKSADPDYREKERLRTEIRRAAEKNAGEPLRKCKCGAVAYTAEDLELFTKDLKCNYNRSNTCRACGSNYAKAQYHQHPEVKARVAEYSRQPEAKAKAAEYSKEYNQRPEVKVRTAKRMKEYNQRPEVKARAAERAREYNQRPESKAKKAERSRRYYESKKITPSDYQPEEPITTQLKIRSV